MRTVQSIKKSALKTLFIVSALTAGAFSQGTADTAYVPFVVGFDSPNPAYINSNPRVQAVPAAGNTGSGANKNIPASKINTGVADTLAIPLGKGVSVSYRPQGQANAQATFSYNRGNVSLRLHPQHYGNAEISLFSVNGKRVLRGKASASKAGGINISKSNIVAGVYMLSAKGTDGGSFASRMTHDGGKLNINVTFGSGNISLTAAAGDYGTWRITVSANGYADSAYDFSPDKGVNPTQNITLRLLPLQPPVGQINCTRAGLTAAVDAYIAALEAGDHTLLPLAANAKYSEYDHDSKQDYRTGSLSPSVKEFGQGLWKKPRVVDFHRNLIDTVECASFSEVIINKDSKDTANNPPYVIGVRIDVSGGQISEIRVLVTTFGDWAFTATDYYKHTMNEQKAGGWDILPPDQRLTRERLKSDAEAYFRYFSDTTVVVPWGNPPRCARLEGGAYTGDWAGATCKIGVPYLQMSISTIWYLVDVDYGMAVLFVYFGGADSHWFRILPTGYRYIHTLTAMKQSDYIAP